MEINKQQRWFSWLFLVIYCSVAGCCNRPSVHDSIISEHAVMSILVHELADVEN